MSKLTWKLECTCNHMLELVNVGLTLLGLPLGLVLDGLILGRGETHGPHHFLCISRIIYLFIYFLHGGYDKEEVKIFIIIIHSKKMFVQENKHYAWANRANFRLRSQTIWMIAHTWRPLLRASIHWVVGSLVLQCQCTLPWHLIKQKRIKWVHWWVAQGLEE